MEVIDCVVIGAGVIGLAIARSLARRGLAPIVLEAGRVIGGGISSRNSEVIHAGLYYPHGSLKAELCVRGRNQLYAYCEARHVPHRRCGKLVVAADHAQLDHLEGLYRSGRANGVDDLHIVEGAALRALEPRLAGVAALMSPSTGIIDSHAYMLALQGEAEAAGATIAFGSRVAEFRPGSGHIALRLSSDVDPVIGARVVINAAGLDAHRLANMLKAQLGAPPVSLFHTKGSYFTLTGRAPFSRLIYPVPEPGGLGVHLTLDLAGQARFGPDAEAVDGPDFAVDPARAGAFYDAIRTYWPDLANGALTPGYAGVRPRLTPISAPTADFRIDRDEAPGSGAMLSLLGIESPGLTASLPLGDEIAELVGFRLYPKINRNLRPPASAGTGSTER